MAAYNNSNRTGRNALELILSHELYRGPKATADFLKHQFPTISKNIVKEYPSSDAALEISDTALAVKLRLAANCQIQKYSSDRIQDALYGGVVPNFFNNDVCKCRTAKNDYDSKDHQIEAPILYIAGTQDPATPIEEAKYHFNHQKSSAKKVFLEIFDAGHNPSENLAGCERVVFDSAISGHLSELAPPRDLFHGCSTERSLNFNTPAIK